MQAELIAPCGMNCTLCKDYQAYINNVPIEKGKTNHCPGCQIRNKNCIIKKGCPKLRKKQITHCHQCTQIPCKNLEHLDRRYREHYNMSMIENPKTNQRKRHRLISKITRKPPQMPKMRQHNLGPQQKMLLMLFCE